MPRAKSHARSETFNAMHAEAAKYGERGDCSVKAVAVACGVSYDVALETLTRLGRKPGCGTPVEISRKAVEALGYEIRELRYYMRDGESLRTRFIDRYPQAHRILKSVTSHHADRFPDVWKDGTYILYNGTHMWCVKNGVNHDWSRGRALRVDCVWVITRKEQA